MLHDRLAEDLYTEICRIPLVDSHSHIDPHQPTARTLDDLLSYHYYTELAHSAGMDKGPLEAAVEPHERVRAILYYMSCFDNTAQFHWFLEIARAFLNFQGQRFSIADTTWLCNVAEDTFGRPGWEEQVFRQTNLERVFLTNDFDDPLANFDSSRYIPCLRVDDLVFRLGQAVTRGRLAKATGVEVRDGASFRRAATALFDHFTRHEARACAISLPPNFAPARPEEGAFSAAIQASLKASGGPDASPAECGPLAYGVFWTLAEHCSEYGLPFYLMAGVNRKVYEAGVHQGQDLFDSRMSLMQLAPLFNAFPKLTFCISVLSSGLNQELASFSWIFPNVMAAGHWWYANVPALIQQDLRVRLQAIPKTKQIGYYSDMYKLEFGLPKFNMYRRILAQVLADDFIRPRFYSEAQAVELARLLLRDNARRIFNLP
jgi:glucuronate isomerase